MSDTQDIEYVQVTVKDLDEVLDLLATEFYPRENMSKSVGDDGTTSRTGIHSKTVRNCLPFRVSVGARDKATGSLVGVRTSYITTREDKMSEEDFQLCSDKERKLYMLLDKAKGIHDVFQDPEVDKVLDFDRLCVHTDYCRRGIAKKMVELSMDLAAKKGCQLARSLVTSPYSEKLFLRLGFQIKSELDVKKLEKDTFDLSLVNYTAVKVMTKRL